MAPVYSFSQQRHGDVITLITFAILSLLIICVADYFRRLAKRLEDEEHLRQLAVRELAHRLRSPRHPASVRAALAHEDPACACSKPHTRACRVPCALSSPAQQPPGSMRRRWSRVIWCPSREDAPGPATMAGQAATDCRGWRAGHNGGSKRCYALGAVPARPGHRPSRRAVGPMPTSQVRPNKFGVAA
jgi:hypothetical protein